MRIFGKKKKTEPPELAVEQVAEKGRYDFWAALAKAVLLFLLVYGAIGGFLSAYEIEYNNGLCMLALLGLSFVLSAVYETGKRWLTNLVSLLSFSLYLYIALSNYWIINSGYYGVLNRVYEVARQYLDIQGGVEYTMAVEESYMTVTVFAIFLGIVGVILLNIMLQNKCSLPKVILLTLTPYALPFYFECSPGLIYILFLLTGYVTVAVIQGGNVGDHLSRQIRYVLPLAAVLAVLFVRTAALLLPQEDYENIRSKSALKASTEKSMESFAQYGLMAFFMRGSSSAGISGGVLSRNAAVMPTGETHLIVRYTPYSFDPVYLKAFTGLDYIRGSRWTEAGDGPTENVLMSKSVEGRRRSYESDTDRQFQGKGIMEVEIVGASQEYEYRPYYTEDETVRRRQGITSYTYYPYYTGEEQKFSVEDAWDERYLTVSESCSRAVRAVCEEAGFAGTEEEIAEQIVAYFKNNYSYTMRPGYYLGNPDYITHFLLESRKGYCSHFASAATMLFRQMGIPARYVEGYAFSYVNVMDNAELVEGAEYKEYYDGYAPIGETALVELEIPDAYAHAWVEVYMQDKGWVVVDPTPAQTSQEENASFWDVFLNNGNDQNGPDMAQNNVGAYLEAALGGVSYAVMIAVILFILIAGGLYFLRVQREKKLPGRERVKLEYGRVCDCLNRKYRDYRRLRTLREQLDWIREYGQPIDEEQETDLYRIFFAEDCSCDYDLLCGQLRKIKNQFRYGRVRRK